MITLRSNVFETNSSSCHTLTMISEADYEQLKTLDFVLVNFKREIYEHETFIEAVDHKNIKTLDEAVDLYKDDVKNFSGKVPEYYTEYVDFIKLNWGRNLLKYILFEDCKEIQEKLDNYKFTDGNSPDTYELREILWQLFNLKIESYVTLFDGDSEVDDTKEVISPKGDKVFLFDISTAC